MIPNLYEEDLACASSPYRFTWPRELLHGSSPLTRQERSPLSSFSSTASAPSSKLPPFVDVFEAAAEPPPPYTELPRVPFASCYALAYDRPLKFQHHVVDVSFDDDSSNDVEMSVDDELRYLGQLTIDMASDFGEVETLSPTSTSFAESSSSSLGPWRTPKQRHRRSLLRRKPNAAGQRALASLRMNFILQNVPHLALSLRQFEERALAPVADVFYSWYEQLSSDQRVRYMPWFVPERLDLVRAEQPSNAQGKASSPAATAQAGSAANEKAASQSTTVPSQSKAAAMAAAAHEAMKRKAARSTSPPPSCTSLPGWEDLDQAIRLLRVMPNRQASRDLMKEATIRAWKTAVAELGWTQWFVSIL